MTSGLIKRQSADVTCIERHYSVRFQPLRVCVILLLIFKIHVNEFEDRFQAIIKNNLVGTLATGVELDSVYRHASLRVDFELNISSRAQILEESNRNNE